MTERERTRPTAPFVRLTFTFQDHTVYSRRWASDADDAPPWRGVYANASPWPTDDRPARSIGDLVATDLGRLLIAAHAAPCVEIRQV
ncbi:MAG TPA: hypothetical protein VKE41_03130 [Roseiflexaceae bacterium]|nr:hypothetical protein [Roseiflexaceae bacterium]